MLWFAHGSASRQCRGRRRATAVGWRDRLESDPRRRRQRLLVRDYNGKKADRLLTRIDPGVVSPLAELRAHEWQAAEELGQRKTHHEERRVVDASPASITLAMLLTDEEGIGKALLE